MKTINRKDFLSQVGLGTAALLVPLCMGGISSCQKKDVSPTLKVDFTVDTATGALSINGGSLVQSGVVVARTKTGAFIAVAAACTHEGTTVDYMANSNSFYCSNHGATFNYGGGVTGGPTSQNLTKYNTSLSGTKLRVFS